MSHGLTVAACLLLVTTHALSAAPPEPSATTRSPRRQLPLTAVRVTDAFWAPRLQVYRERTIPHSWQYVQGEIEDNEIAAGWKHLERGDGTPWNQANLHKVLETCAYALAQQPNPELSGRVDEVIKALTAAQQPNGYLNALLTVRHIEPWSWMEGRHEGYVAGHLIEAAVAHYLATGRRDLLDLACRNADHIYDEFVTQARPGVCGHAELELALVRLYRVTGEQRYLQLAREWVERYGTRLQGPNPAHQAYFMNHLPIRQVPEVTGHAVRTMFYLTGVAGVATETGDPTLAAAARRLWRNTTRQKMLVTGSAGTQASDEGFGANYELPPDGYAESCAACGLLGYAHAMFLLDGEAESYDILERVLYNAVLHGISLDGTTTYYRNPLTDADHPRDNCWVCCPPCLSRTLLRLPDYIYARGDRDLYVNLYVGSEAEVALKSGPVRIAQVTAYPWDGTVSLTVNPSSRAAFALRLRLPGWCRTATVRLNGQAVTPRRLQGYAVLDRTWRAGDKVELDLPMPVERLVAHPAAQACAGQVTLQRGPLVYGFEALDNEGDLGLTLPPDPQFTTEHRADLLAGVTVITGRRADGRRWQAVPFYALANRGLSRQVVWVKQEGLTALPGDWASALYRPWQP